MRKLSVLTALVLILAACGDTGGDQPAADAVAAAATTTLPPATTAPAPETTEAPPTTHMEMSDDSMHEDEAAHEDDSMEEMSEEAGPADRAIEIEINEFAFVPGSIAVSAGETVQFVVSNTGSIEHEFRLSNAHRIEEHLAAGHADHGEEEGHHEGGDVFVTVAAGDTGELVVTFPDDTTLYTEIACLIEGHYEAGMLGAISYEG